MDKQTIINNVLYHIHHYMVRRNNRYAQAIVKPKTNQALRKEIWPILEEQAEGYEDQVINHLIPHYIKHYDGLEFTFADDLVKRQSPLFGKYAHQ